MVCFPSIFHLEFFFLPTFLFCSFFYLFIFNVFTTTSAFDSEISYDAHCSSIIPQVNTSTSSHHPHLQFPYLQEGTGYHIGGDRLFGSRSPYAARSHFYLYPSGTILETTISGVYRVEAHLNLGIIYRNFSYVDRRSNKKIRLYQLEFVLDGFWSEPAGKICMVGRAERQSEEGESINLEGVFKLSYASKNTTMFTSLAKGSLESLSESNDPRYFEPIKIVYFPPINGYDFKLGSECVGGDEIPQSLPISLQERQFCSSLFPRNDFELQYASNCMNEQNCSPFERDNAYLPQALTLIPIQCFDKMEKVRYLLKFSNRSNFYGELDYRTILIGEGSWDREKNQMCIVACKILQHIDSPANAYVDDCSIRLSLRIPAIWTIKNTNKIVGQIWTNKTASGPGYFKKIRFSSSVDYGNNLLGQKYVYTQVGSVEHSCYANNPGKNGKRYPNEYSRDMSFDILVKQSNETISWGRASPISVSDNLYFIRSFGDTDIDTTSEDMDISSTSKPMNISYKISIYGIKLNDHISSLNSSAYPFSNLDITAEGVYNPQTGVVCMVGCMHLESDTHKSNKESLDCEIIVNFEFPPLYSTHKGLVEGFVYSKRVITDPLYFKGFNISSASVSSIQARRSTQRTALEIILALVSNTFSVIFLASQIFYVKKHPEKLPFVSQFMLGILTLGHLIPLMFDFLTLIFNSKYQQNVILQAVGWLVMTEVSVRIVTLVALVLLLFRLHQLAWTSRLRNEIGKACWDSEQNSVFVLSPVYLVFGVINFFFNLHKAINVPILVRSSGRVITRIEEPTLTSILNYVKSYSGLNLDGYLFPQIIFNIFHNSRESALSPVFYVGTTLLRVLPHVYDLYRIHNYVNQDFGGPTSIYANHTTNLYSIAWDVIISCVCVLFALVIFLQQRFGGDCVLPKKFRQVQLYAKAPAVETNEIA